jgi:hypothetical protein
MTNELRIYPTSLKKSVPHFRSEQKYRRILDTNELRIILDIQYLPRSLISKPQMCLSGTTKNGYLPACSPLC